ncbi:IclR family transcriptional regulator domain-containing protein [Glacieibacterium frigidum]|uniref:Helix-turn-helix domain-containing protein n=1 Tax=Glacieibacterium frigidum TaxID=2593303 RepID=A0A552U883_9SPHN|nr:helix-turn-helix domain-containing protein [Glacieibacterium frigidum]TRW14434.1 helix-turn-helix domain-containing protein [Glacieibacterium frigidum]
MEKGVPIRSLSRGIAVLQAVNRGGSLSMMQIARTSEVPYPTACRIVQTLLFEGLIEREPARKRYRPTALIQTLAYGFQGHAPLVQAARAHIVELTRHVGWPISLSTHIGHSMVIRDSTHALTSLTFNHYYPGYTLPVLECAAGLVYLAHLPPEEQSNILQSLKLMRNATSTHIITLLEKEGLAAEIRAQGYATRGNNTFTANPGKTSSIAVPIFEGGHVAGCLTLAFFSSAIKMADAVRQFVDPLKASAAAIEAELSRGNVAVAA